MIRRTSLVLATILIGFLSASRADHLPENLLARGKAETKLAGIRMNDRTRLADVIKLYGQPTRVESWESDEPNISSSYDYYWAKPGLNLHVQVERLPRRIPAWERVNLIEVGSGTSRKIGKTGRGLRIGQPDLRRLYGRRFHLRNIPKRKIHDVMLQWREEEFSLVATLDRHNRIIGLSLSAPE
jgi:hypothetical protein